MIKLGISLYQIR